MSDTTLSKAGAYARESLVEVLETMVGLTDVDAGDPNESDGPIPESELTGFIGLAGEYEGGISIHASQAVGARMGAAMLGIEDLSELSADEMRDAFGEIANMVAGGIKTRFDADDVRFDISVPVVVSSREAASVQYRLVSPLVTLDAKVEGELVRVGVSIAKES